MRLLEHHSAPTQAVIHIFCDNPGTGEALCRDLSDWGFDSYGASSIQHLHNLSTAHRPDLVVIDARGSQIITRDLVQQLTDQFTPAFVLLGKGAWREESDILHAGAIDCMIEPFDLDDLRERLPKLLIFGSAIRDLPEFNRPIRSIAQGKRVLIAEDHYVSRRLLERYLSNWIGQEAIIVAEDGEQVLNICREHDIDVVITDWMMPKRDGLEIVRALSTERPKVATMILTAKSHKEEIATGLDAGADIYVIKPFAPDELAARLRLLLLVSIAVRKDTVERKFGVLRGQRILLVCQRDEDRHRIASLLSNRGCEITVESNGATALREVLMNAFHHIIVSLELPLVSGDAFFFAVQRAKPEACRRVLLMINRDNPIDLGGLGCKHIYSPFSDESLLDAIAIEN